MASNTEDLKNIWKTSSASASSVQEPFIYKLFDQLELSEKYEQFKSQLETQKRDIQAKKAANDTLNEAKKHSEVAQPQAAVKKPQKIVRKFKDEEAEEGEPNQKKPATKIVTPESVPAGGRADGDALAQNAPKQKNRRKKKKHFIKKQYNILYVKQEDDAGAAGPPAPVPAQQDNHSETSHFLSHNSTESEIDDKLGILSCLDDEEDLDANTKKAGAQHVAPPQPQPVLEAANTPVIVPQVPFIVPTPLYMVYVMNTNMQLVPCFVSAEQYANALQGKVLPDLIGAPLFANAVTNLVLPTPSTAASTSNRENCNDAAPAATLDGNTHNACDSKGAVDDARSSDAQGRDQDGKANAIREQSAHTFTDGLYFDKDNDSIVSAVQYCLERPKRCFAKKIQHGYEQQQQQQQHAEVLLSAPPNLPHPSALNRNS